jgi:hypothetical protein
MAEMVYGDRPEFHIALTTVVALAKTIFEKIGHSGVS